MKISLPLFVDLPRKTMKDKRIYFNLNVYRNLCFQVNNRAKIAFKHLIQHQIHKLPKMEKINLEYTLYTKTKRLCDTSNILCIVDKFFCDALVESGKIPDDNYNHILEVSYKFGGIDKIDSRCDVEIIEL